MYWKGLSCGSLLFIARNNGAPRHAILERRERLHAYLRSSESEKAKSGFTFCILNLNARDRQMYTENCQQSQKYNQAALPLVLDRILIPSCFRELSHHEVESTSRDYYACANSVKRSPSLESSVIFPGAIAKCTRSVTKLWQSRLFKNYFIISEERIVIKWCLYHHGCLYLKAYIYVHINLQIQVRGISVLVLSTTRNVSNIYMCSEDRCDILNICPEVQIYT